MVTLHHGPAWKLSVYGREHGVPHFPIEGPGSRCSIGIASLQPIVGTAPPAVLRAARAWALRAAHAWAQDNQAALPRTWRELNG